MGMNDYILGDHAVLSIADTDDEHKYRVRESNAHGFLSRSLLKRLCIPFHQLGKGAYGGWDSNPHGLLGQWILSPFCLTYSSTAIHDALLCSSPHCFAKVITCQNHQLTGQPMRPLARIVRIISPDAFAMSCDSPRQTLD